jgi:hypothetical protein
MIEPLRGDSLDLWAAESLEHCQGAVRSEASRATRNDEARWKVGIAGRDAEGDEATE